MERALFFLDEEKRSWGRDFVSRFSLLPGNSLGQALDLAEEAVQSDVLELLFFILRSFLHDALLCAQALRSKEVCAGQGDLSALHVSGWSDKVPSFAGMGIPALLEMRLQLQEIERGQAVNINLKLAFEAFFTQIAVL